MALSCLEGQVLLQDLSVVLSFGVFTPQNVSPDSLKSSLLQTS